MNAADPFGLVGQVLDGQFRVDKLVGEGGFSAVYRGHHQGLNEPIAIKCLKLPAALGTSLVDTFVQRFRDESRILYRLSQGNLHVVRSIAAGTTQAPATGALVPYMVLEWLEGRSVQSDFTVRRTVGEKGRTLDELVKLFDTAADGLGYAHAQGVVHRDLNPGNLFLASTQHGVKMKVLDFGVAKLMHDGPLNLGPRAQTVGQIKIFAPAYGAPEQFDDRIGQVGAASDVYSFALILLEALRDKNVVEGTHLGEFAQSTCDPNKRPTPRSLGIDVPDEVEQAFVRATALDPKERWRNASDFWQSLTIALKIAIERKHEEAARETPSLDLPGHGPALAGPPPGAPAPAVSSAAIGGKNLNRTMPLGANTPGLPPGFPRPGGAGAPAAPRARVPTTIGIPAPAVSPRVGAPAAAAPLAPPAAPPRASGRPPSTSTPRGATPNIPPMPAPMRSATPFPPRSATPTPVPPRGPTPLPPRPVTPFPPRPAVGGAGAARAPSDRPATGTDRPAAPMTARFPSEDSAPARRDSASMAATRMGGSGAHDLRQLEEEEDEATKVHAPTPEVLRTLALHDANARAGVQAAIAAAQAVEAAQGRAPGSPTGDLGDEVSMLEAAARDGAMKPPLADPARPGPARPLTPMPPSLGGTLMMAPPAHAPAAKAGARPAANMSSTMAMPPPSATPGAAFAPVPPPPPYHGSSVQGLAGSQGSPQGGPPAPQGAPQVTEPLHIGHAQAMSNAPNAQQPGPGMPLPYGHGSAIVPPVPSQSQAQPPGGGAPFGAPPIGAPPTGASPTGAAYGRPSTDQPFPAPSFAQPQSQAGEAMGPGAGVAAPAKPLPIVPIAIGLVVLALGGIGLGALALRARHPTSPGPLATSSSAAPVDSASVAPSAVAVPDTSAEPTAAVEADAAPAAAEITEEDDAATTAAAASDSAAPSASVATTTTAPTTTPGAPVFTWPPPAAPVAPSASASAKPAVDPNAFNEGAARSRLAQANGVLAFCKKEGGVTGPGNASVTFASDGSVSGVAVDPPYAGTKEGDCVAAQFRRSKVTAFTGAPQTVRHGFEVPK